MQKVLIAVITALGTIAAAWVGSRQGFVAFPNPALQKEVGELKARLESRSKLSGDLEWQWAGDNWLGSVALQNLADGTISATTEVRQLKADPKTHFQTFQDTLAFRSAVPGSATISSDQSTISLHLPIVISPEYLKTHRTHSSNVMLDAELHSVDAFAGRVRIIGEQTTEGDMILVHYKSDMRRW